MYLILKFRDLTLTFLSKILQFLLPESWFDVLRSARAKAFGNRYFSARAKNYNHDRVSQPSWWAEFEALKDIATSLGPDLRVLDLPVGTGRFFPIYGNLGWRVVGLDVSRDMLNEAEAAASLNLTNSYSLKLADARKTDFPDGSFDVVVCFRFLQSIVSFEDARSVLAEISRVTNAWAVLHLNVALDCSHRISFPRPHQPMKGHLNWASIKNLLVAYGLEIQEAQGPMPNPDKNEYVVLCRKLYP